MIFQPLSISCTMCFPSLVHSFFHYISICLYIKPSNKTKRLMTKATNQGCQLVVFLDNVVGWHLKWNALGNKLAMGHENYWKKFKTCSKHETFCKVGPFKEPNLENHVSKVGTHNKIGPCDWMQRQKIPWLMILFFWKFLENAMRLFGVRKGASFEKILMAKKIMCWKIYG
jgi:hypothetical protein